MMSDLDKKLYKILKEVDSEDRFDENFINLQALFVKKAFIDEGWRFDPLTTQNIAVREDGTLYPADPRSNLMTGKEWYKRFKRGLLGYFDEGGDFPKYLNGYKTIEVLGVAARASGIENE